ncbi:hypothetical protein LCGC14_1209230 [marine sediment metagenome]|uniref:Right handed beta helix domain-containing protein n=1 Tax=marine sediment metagenome TaxID=412755 RepID=A0A0F9LIW2_9ZZZZ
MIVVSLLFAIPVKDESQGNVSSEQEFLDLKSSAFSTNTSDYITFVGPPIDTAPPSNITNFRIFIDDADPNYNWSKTASENAWITGSGTPGDPYIIENLYINAHGFGGGVQISRSTKYFIIRNNWINNSGKIEYDAGILLYDTVENGIVEDNLITYVKKGIFLQFSCSNITVRSNYLLSDHTTVGYGRSIKVTDSHDVTLTDNIAINFYHGFQFIRNVNIIFRGNYITDTIWGPDFTDSPVDLRMSNSMTITYNGFGGAYTQSTSFIFMVDSTGNVVFNNSQTIAHSDLEISGGEGLQTQATDTSLLNLFESHDNYIAHNFKFEVGSSQGSSQEIPGFNLTLLIGIIGISSVVIFMLQRKKH